MISPALQKELQGVPGAEVQFNAPSRDLVGLRCGGALDALARPQGRAPLAALLGRCARAGVAWRVLGRGFNTLVREEGAGGCTIQLRSLQSIALEQRPGGPLVRAEAGVSHAAVSRFCGARGLSGLEFAAGIPGTVGGWAAMNAGVPAREIKDVLHSVDVLAPYAHGMQSARIGREALQFGYRELTGLPEGALILAARFRVQPSDANAVRAEIARQLARRAKTQPLAQPSCGSVFKNPPGAHAGELIEAAGLKGARAGGAEISAKHANFIVNLGAAAAGDVLELISRAQNAVQQQSGVALEPELHIWGRKA